MTAKNKRAASGGFSEALIEEAAAQAGGPVGLQQPLYTYLNGHVQKYDALPKPETVAEQFGNLPKPVEPITFYVSQVSARNKHKWPAPMKDGSLNGWSTSVCREALRALGYLQS